MFSVFLDSDSFDSRDISFESLKSTTPKWKFYGATRETELLERISQASIIVSNKVMLDRQALISAKNLKLICIAATGTNNVDLIAAKELGIPVCNVVNYATASLVQHVFTLIFALSTRLIQYNDAVQSGLWNRSEQFCLLDFPIRELAGKTIGIVGYGELGSSVARAAECFGLNVMIAQRPNGSAQEGRIPLPELLPQVDILSLHCPLTDDTRGLIGAAEFALMKDDALLINTARGGIVDESALAAALVSRQIGGAGIDTITEEPPVNGNVLIDKKIPNLIVTPHIAWASRASRQRLIDGVAANIGAFLLGKPINLVS